MSNKMAYLGRLCDSVFKLLPMREDADSGADNHLKEYIEFLCDRYDGWLCRYPDLEGIEELIEVGNYLAYLRENMHISFMRWRSIVLRSARLIQQVYANCTEVTEEDDG